MPRPTPAGTAHVGPAIEAASLFRAAADAAPDPAERRMLDALALAASALAGGNMADAAADLYAAAWERRMAREGRRLAAATA